MRRILGISAVVLGLLLVVAAGVTKWVIAPQVTQLPGSQNTTRTYAGIAAAMSNPMATQGVVLGPGLLRNVAVDVLHTDRVVSTRGHSAVVADRRLVTIPGFTVADLNVRYAVDRRTFQPVSGFTGVIPARG